MLYPIGLAGLVLLVGVHQLGTYAAARALGVDVARGWVGYAIVRGGGWRRPGALLGGSLASYLAAAALAFALYLSGGAGGETRYYAVERTLEGFAAHDQLRADDRILTVDGAPVRIGSGPKLGELVALHGGAPVALGILRDGATRTVTIAPKRNEEGRLLLGVQTRADTEEHALDAGDALAPALAWPAVQARSLIAGLWRMPPEPPGSADPGGPKRIVEEFHAPLVRHAELRFLASIAVWAMLAQLLIDLVALALARRAPVPRQ